VSTETCPTCQGLPPEDGCDTCHNTGRVEVEPAAQTFTGPMTLTHVQSSLRAAGLRVRHADGTHDLIAVDNNGHLAAPVEIAAGDTAEVMMIVPKGAPRVRVRRISEAERAAEDQVRILALEQQVEQQREQIAAAPVVIPLRPRETDGYDGLTCRCGSAWFHVRGVTFAPDGHVTGYAAPVTCLECGERLNP
jgi:hypothetical protein